MEIALIFMGLLIFSSHIFNALFEKTRVPNVLILICIGLIIGPIFGWVHPESIGKMGRIFTTITLISMLYASGTTLRIKEIGKAIGGATMLTILNFLTSLGIGMAIGYYLLDLDLVASAFIGAAFGSISSAVIIPMLEQLKLGEKAQNIIFLESALSDVICLVAALALLDAMNSGVIDILMILKNMGVSLFFATIIGGVTGFFWMILQSKILANIKNTMFTSFALAFILYGVCELMKLNGGIAVLAYGIMVGNMGEVASKLNKFVTPVKSVFLKTNEKNFYSEIVFILQTYFFVYVGLSIKLNDINLIMVGALLIVLIFIVRIPVINLLSKASLSNRDILLMNILTPKGLITAVLASLPLQAAVDESGIATGEIIQNVAYAGVLISILLCSFFVILFSGKQKEAVQAGQSLEL